MFAKHKVSYFYLYTSECLGIALLRCMQYSISCCLMRLLRVWMFSYAVVASFREAKLRMEKALQRIVLELLSCFAHKWTNYYRNENEH